MHTTTLTNTRAQTHTRIYTHLHAEHDGGSGEAATNG